MTALDPEMAGYLLLVGRTPEQQIAVLEATLPAMAAAGQDFSGPLAQLQNLVLSREDQMQWMLRMAKLQLVLDQLRAGSTGETGEQSGEQG